MVQIQPNGSKSGQISGNVYDLEKGQKLSLEIIGISIRTTEEVKLLGITTPSCNFRVMWKLFVKRQTKRSKRFLELLGIYKSPKPTCFTRLL